MRRRQQDTKHQCRKLRAERLEDRVMLSANNLIAQFQGDLSSSSPLIEIPITINPDDFTLQGGRVVLGFHLQSPSGSVSYAKWKSEFGTTQAMPGAGVDLNGNGLVDGADFLMLQRVTDSFGSASQLDPAAVLIRDGSGNVVATLFEAYDVYGSVDGLTVAELSAGSYTLELRSQYETAGAFELDIFLAGDADGNGLVDTTDHGVIVGAYGAQQGSDEYVLAADANLDGRITAFDRSMWQRNRGDATTVMPLFLELDSVPRVVNVAQFSLAGITIPGQVVELDSDQDGSFDDGSTVADDQGVFAFDVALNDGLNTLAVRTSDRIGQHQAATVELTRTSATLLAEGNRFVTSLSQIIPLAFTEGSRTLTIDIHPLFDTSDSSALPEDLFQVYLIDPATGATLLDHGDPGTAFFSLSGAIAEFVPGQVTYNGSRITVDLTSLGALSEGELRFQLLNTDLDNGTLVEIVSVVNKTGIDGKKAILFPTASNAVAHGGPVDLTSFIIDDNLKALLSNVRFDESTGRYAAELRVKNTGPATGRNIVVAFDNLPAEVNVLDPSGYDALGNPYWSLQPAVRPGGLGAGAISDPILIEMDNPLLQRFALQATVFNGGPNRAPNFATIGPITVTPGEKVTIPLIADDPDGDAITFLLDGMSGSMPTGMLRSNGRWELTPKLNELGTYVFDLLASDGALQTRQTVSVSVIPDADTVTRISGVVKNTLDQPLAGVPVEIAGFSTVTGADGSFTIALPTMKVPTESFNIPVPAGDTSFDPLNTGTQEISLRRARYDVTTGDSASNPRQYPNLVSSFLDASVIYGSDVERADALRTFEGGKLKTGNGNLLPTNDTTTFSDGPLENDNEGRADPAILFASGDVRTNENVALIALQTLLVREHNRLADEVATAYPSYNDQEIYESARRMLGAILQHITYSEYLPLLLGPDALAPYVGYDPAIDPSQSGLFAVAAFRIGHSQLFGDIQRLDANGQSLPGGSLSLQNAFFTTQPIQDDGIEPYLRGLFASQAEEIDTHVIDDVRNMLFGPPGSGGLDLASLNIQRGRDMGLPSYNQARLDFGLAPVTSFGEITSDTAVQAALEDAYETVDQMDVWVGGIAEGHADEALVGPLFQRIIADQFSRTRNGDRFWYENSQFTETELSQIRSTTLTSLILRNTTIAEAELASSVFTTGELPPAPSPSGAAATTPASESRSFDGTGNNTSKPELGSTGQHLAVNYTASFGDGVSSPAGADRPGARFISNTLSAQTTSTPNATGATGFLVFWGQLIDHDLGLTPGGVSDTLKILGNQKQDSGDENYPFVAEPMHLLLGHAVYPGVNNFIDRPIYLPELDVENGTAIDPNQDVIVTTPTIPGAQVTVEQHTLLDRQGQEFTGVLSITEVPRNLTPAALPPNLFPDTVVTIQPAEMVFSQPAPLSLPNRSGWVPGTVMDLWSINPNTGVFDKVGTGRVSADGTVVETISGGIRNSSWHFFTPPPDEQRDPKREGENQDQACNSCESRTQATSEVELHSGAVVEEHDLVTYESLGVTRGISLHYNSQRADPRPIITFGTNNAQPGDERFLVARLAFSDGSATYEVEGFEGGMGLPGGEHFWKLPAGANDIKVALQGDLSNQPTGVYEYTLTRGFLRLGEDEAFAGSMTDATGQVVHVNSINSLFGAGWELGGVQQLLENRDGSLLLIDGNGANLIFGAPLNPADQYTAPPGDFSALIKNADGTYTRTMTDQSVYRYDSLGRLVMQTDRNGNQTRHVYENNQLTKIIDPVGLETNFAYNSGGRVSSITDPASRVTTLDYDSVGNLIRITDPDESSRAFEYDTDHHLVTEIDQLGQQEQANYGFHGRATGSVRKDGTTLGFAPVQTRVLLPSEATRNPFSAPMANLATTATTAHSVDANGRVVSTILDQAGQLVSSVDAVGNLPTVRRNGDNLIASQKGARGFVTQLEYDKSGNIVSIIESIGGQGDSRGSLFPGEQFAVGDLPVSSAVGDLDGDGLLDIVTANFLSDNVSILLGNGDGTFQAQRSLAVGDQPESVTLGDVNGDGRLDIITAQSLGANVSILLGNGDGTFQTLQSFLVGSSPRAVILGDANSDGQLDIVTANSGSNVSLLLGNGDGTFQAPRSFVVGSSPRAVTFGDVNSDDQLDIITANSGSDNVSILLGNGDGTFQAQQAFAVGDGPNSVIVGDIDGDGQLDIVTANSSSDNVSVLLGNGDGTFQTPQTTLAVGDQPRSVTLGDVNGDGQLDIITANISSDSVSILLGNGDGTFQTALSIVVGLSPRAVTLGDSNGDGRLDVITSNSFGNNASVLLGNGDGTFQAQQTYSVGNNASSVIVGDLNGDALLDIVTANTNSNNVSILLGNGGGAYQAQQTYDVGDGPMSGILGDFDGDAILDIVTANTDSFSILLGNGDGTFQAQQTFAQGLDSRSTTLEDVNEDGRLDFVIASFSSDNVVIFYGVGDGTFFGSFFAVGDGPTSVILGDINGDATLDIVTANFTSNNVSILLGDGPGNFQAQQTISVGNNPISVTLADVDGDAILDIITANFSGDNVSILLGNGDGTFQAPLTYAVGDGPFSVNLGDVDGDTILDIVTANSDSNSVSILLGNGDGSFQAQKTFAVGDGPSSVILGDVDGDSILDIITANFTSNNVSVLLGSGVGTATRTFEYDANFSQLSRVTDELGRVTLYDIDPANGNRLSETRVVGQVDSDLNGEGDDLVTHFSYAPHGQIDTMTDPLGRVTDYDYDEFGRLVQIIYAKDTVDEATDRFEYDQKTTAGRAGLITAYVDANGHRTEYAYDAMNRLINVIEPDPDGPAEPLLSPITTFDYDRRGNLIQTIDARGNLTRYDYDALDRQIARHDPDPDGVSGPQTSPITRLEYDNYGNVVQIVYPNGNSTFNVYDARNRLVESVDADDGVTQFRYDSDDNLIALTDPVGNRTLFAYDSRDRLVRETDPLGQVITYSYDAADNLIERIDRNGRTTRYEYDKLNRMRAEYWLVSDESEINVVLYTYDANSNLDTVSDAFSFLDFDYDFRNRVTRIDNFGTPGAPHVVLTYSYDDANNVKSVVDTINGVAGAATAYDYDDLDRLVKLTQTGQGLADKRVDFAYNPLGQYEAINRYRDLAGTQLVVGTGYVYDALNRLELLDHRNGSAMQVAFYDFEYDSASRITKITDVDGTSTYNYDDRDQLIGADREAADPRGDESYHYDANGNRQQSHLHDAGYVTGSGNRLLSDGTYTYEYDDEGNMALRTEIATGNYREFTWDHRNRLTAVIDRLADDTPTQDVQFTYDAFDRRISKAVDTTPLNAIDAAIMHFVYDREDVILDFVDADGLGPNAPVLSQRYLHGPAIDQVLAQDDASGTVHWHLTDHLGTVHDLVDPNGAVENHILYDSYGNVLNYFDNAIESRYLFTGREFDVETGLGFNRARYFDGSIGKFISEDPIGFGAGDSNIYRYVANSPLSLSDPWGLEGLGQRLGTIENDLTLSENQKQVAKLKEFFTTLLEAPLDARDVLNDPVFFGFLPPEVRQALKDQAYELYTDRFTAGERSRLATDEWYDRIGKCIASAARDLPTYPTSATDIAVQEALKRAREEILRQDQQRKW